MNHHDAPGPPAVTAEGPLVLAPNPCVTRPCLPGMALAISVGGELCFITRQGALQFDTSALGSPGLTVGHVVVANGTMSEISDVHGEVFPAIEITSIKRAATAP